MEMHALELITESRSFIILKSTRWSFVLSILTAWISVNMGNTVLLLIQCRRSWLTCLMRWRKMMISTCFILKRSGALTLIKNIRKVEETVFMHTTGKILEENHNNFHTHMKNAWTGKLSNSSRMWAMAVKMSFFARDLMDGKSKSTILQTTGPIIAGLVKNAKRRIVLISTIPVKREPRHLTASELRQWTEKWAWRLRITSTCPTS